LNRFISKRDRIRRLTDGERMQEQLWAEGVRKHNQELEKKASLSRLEWAKHLCDVYPARKEEYEQLVQKLMGGGDAA
jgi:hypothetical protein